MMTGSVLQIIIINQKTNMTS